MSEYIVHIAIHDDSRNLALFANHTLTDFKASLQDNVRAGRLGAITSRGDRYTINLLKAVQAAWPSDSAAKMFAFFFGWRSHLAADRQLKTLFRLLEPEIYRTDAIDGPTTISIYQDLFVLRELYQDGELDPFLKGILAPEHASSNLKPLFVGLWQNSLLNLHSFVRQDRQPESWFEQLLSYHQKFYVDAERYVDAYNNIDQAKMKYVVETNRFYDPSDPLLRLTRSLRQGEPDTSIDLEAAMEAAKTQSHYARALRRNWLYLQATTAFWQGKIDLEELQVQFEVDEPHADREVFGALEDADRRKALLQEWHETGGQ